MSKPFGHQVRLRIAARAIGVGYDSLRKWRQRFGLFGTPGQPKRELSVPEVCALRVAAIALHKCRGITVREALEVSANLAVPALGATYRPRGDRDDRTQQREDRRAGCD
jgi:hypothetical protein